MNKILVICGPTATGKTALAAALAKKCNGELVSADSRQVYRSMDLVSGKDRPDVPIWLYDVVDPDEEFSVSHWVRLAQAAIVDIQKRKKLPIVVGGTGLYINALIHPFETIDIPPDKNLRSRNLSVHQLQAMVERGTMNGSDWNNPRRLIRKIEITRAQQENKRQGCAYDTLMIGLTAPLPVLDARIDKRLNTRLQQGMEKEVASLFKKYKKDLPSMTAIGLNEHAYARRQLTWFNKQNDIHWFDVSEKTPVADIEILVGRWYT